MYWDMVDGDENRLGTHELLNVRTLDDLNRSVLANLSRFQDVTCVVGVPRSGLVPASFLALNLNVPLVTWPDFLAGNLAQPYTRRPSEKHRRLESSDAPHIKMLIVDDATSNGTTFGDIRGKIAGMNLDRRITVEYMAAYCTPHGRQHVDHFLEELPSPRVFEWNMMHHMDTRFFCVDLDGVICDDPTIDENDDGEKYIHFCLNARPRLIPSAPVGAIVTARLERYRPQTEKWLREHGVVYERLVMCNLETGEERRRVRAHAKLKASAYSAMNGMLFVESDPGQAEEIFRLTGKPVFCFGIGLFGRHSNAGLTPLASLRLQLEETNNLISEMNRSTSWRITAPLRRAATWFRNLGH